MNNFYEQLIGLYDIDDKQRRGYLFEQLIREIQPWSYRPPISAVGNGEQLDAIYEWDGRIFIIEAKAKEAKIMQSSKEWEDFELKVRRRNKSVVGLFLSLYDIDGNIITQCEMMNREGYSIFVLCEDIWRKLAADPINFELILKYLLIKSRVNNIATVTSVTDIKKWFFHHDEIIQRYRDICVKSSSVFLRRCKQDKHEMLYVKRLLDKKMKDYIKNLYPKALSNTKKVRKVKNGDVSSTFETERAVPPQILIVRDICGSGKTTYAIENALSLGEFVSFSKSASEYNIDCAVESTLQEFGDDYGILGLEEINRPVVCVIDSLDEAQGISNKLKEIKALISLIPRLNSVARKYGFSAYPIVIVFTVREEYWREWESLFEGMHIKNIFKLFSEFKDEELGDALEKYQNAYRYKICNRLTCDDIATLSNPLNLYIFSETNKFSGNIEVSQVFTASVLHNYFKIKSEEVIDKRRIPSITPRILLDICENFLSLCVYKSLQLNRSDFYESLNTYTPIFVPYLEELLRIYESELIFHFDEDGILAIRHMKFFEYLYADYMIQKCINLKPDDSALFLDEFVDKINSAKIVDLIAIYNNVKYLYTTSIKKYKPVVQIYLDRSNEFVRKKLCDLRCRIALGQEGRINDYDQIVSGMNISDGNLLLEAFFVCAAKCNSANKEELLMLFLKAWKANKDCDHRWKMLPKLYLYDLLDDKKVMTEIAKSTSWKEWQVYVAYLLQKDNAHTFIEFIQESNECDVSALLQRGGEWLYVKDLIDKCCE